MRIEAGPEAGTDVGEGEGAARAATTHGAVRGVRWLFWLNAATLPMSFVTNVVLGRASVEALGLYSAIQILVGTFQTFFIFGGHAVFTRLVPRLSSDRRMPFLVSYVALVVAMFTTVAIPSVLFGGGLVHRVLAPFGGPSPALAYVVGVAIVVWVFCSHFLYAVESAPHAAVSLKLVVVGYFVLSVLCVSPWGRGLLASPSPVLWLTTGVTYNVAALVAATLAIRAAGFPHLRTFRMELPAGFWAVVAYTHLGTVVEYVYSGLSSTIVLLWLDVAALGRLTAALRFVSLIALIPGMLVSVIAPGLSRLESTGQRAEALRQARVAMRAAELAVVPVVLALVVFAPWLMAVFGAGYRPYAGLLRIVALSALAGPTVYLGGGLAIAFGALRTYLAVSIVYIVSSVALNFTLIPAWGLTGAAIATTVSSGVQAAVVTFVLRRLGFQTPRSTVWGAVFGLVTFGLSQLVEPSWIAASALWVAVSLGFSWAAGLTASEARLFAVRLAGSR